MLDGFKKLKKGIYYVIKETMRKFLGLLIMCLIGGMFILAQEKIEKIEIIGNDRVSSETILYYLTVKEGDYFNFSQLRQDFRVLWSTGFFSYLKMEDEDGVNGKILSLIHI